MAEPELSLVPMPRAGPTARCIICAEPADPEFSTACRKHALAAGALFPHRRWSGDLEVEAAESKGLRGRITQAARYQNMGEERGFFLEDVGTSTIIGGRWTVTHVPVPVEKFEQETGRAPAPSKVVTMPDTLGGGRVVMCSSDDLGCRPRLELFKEVSIQVRENNFTGKAQQVERGQGRSIWETLQGAPPWCPPRARADALPAPACAPAGSGEMIEGTQFISDNMIHKM